MSTKGKTSDDGFGDFSTAFGSNARQIQDGGSSALDAFLKEASGENYANNLQILKSTGNLGDAFSDPLRETGFKRQEQVRATRLQAMIKPDEFHDSRDAALQEVAKNINNVYYQTFSEYASAGYPSYECKAKALAAAKIAKAQGEESIEARFGTLETKMADVKTIAKAQVENSGFDLGAR